MKEPKIEHLDFLRPSVRSIFISNRQVAFDPSPKSISGAIEAEENAFDEEIFHLLTYSYRNAPYCYVSINIIRKTSLLVLYGKSRESDKFRFKIFLGSRDFLHCPTKSD